VVASQEVFSFIGNTAKASAPDALATLLMMHLQQCQGFFSCFSFNRLVQLAALSSLLLSQLRKLQA
jgi:hypothetical protein